MLLREVLQLPLPSSPHCPLDWQLLLESLPRPLKLRVLVIIMEDLLECLLRPLKLRVLVIIMEDLLEALLRPLKLRVLAIIMEDLLAAVPEDFQTMDQEARVPLGLTVDQQEEARPAYQITGVHQEARVRLEPIVDRLEVAHLDQCLLSQDTLDPHPLLL